MIYIGLLQWASELIYQFKSKFKKTLEENQVAWSGKGHMPLTTFYFSER